MPLDTVKTKMQLQRYPGMVACTRSIVASDGVHGLYYGFRPFLLQASGKAAVRFSIYESIIRAVDACGFDRKHAPAKWSMFCGLGAVRAPRAPPAMARAMPPVHARPASSRIVEPLPSSHRR